MSADRHTVHTSWTTGQTAPGRSVFLVGRGDPLFDCLSGDDRRDSRVPCVQNSPVQNDRVGELLGLSWKHT